MKKKVSKLQQLALVKHWAKLANLLKHAALRFRKRRTACKNAYIQSTWNLGIIMTKLLKNYQKVPWALCI